MSLDRMDAVVGKLLGGLVPPMALIHDLHDEYGWQQQRHVPVVLCRGLVGRLGDLWPELKQYDHAFRESR